MTYATAPYATAPYATSTTSTIVVGPVAETFSALDTARGSITKLLADAASAGEGINGQTVQAMIDSLRLSGMPAAQLDMRESVDDGVRFNTALVVAWHIMASEGLDFVGVAAAQATRLATVIDTLHAIGAVSTRLDARAAVATVLAVNGMLATGWKMEAIDTASFQDALAGSLRAVGLLVDTAGFADTPAPSMRLSVIAADDVAIDTVASARMTMFEAITDSMVIYATLRLGDGEYAGWVLNEGAASEYRNYPFNGFVEFPRGSKRYYGTADDGLYLLEGKDDAGTPIDAHIKTALMDFGSGQHKRVPDVYVAFIGGDTLLCKVITTNQNGSQTEVHYTSAVVPGDAMHNGRIKVGRGLKSRYWQFALCNVDGADFDLDEVAFRPLFLDRRL